MKFSTDTDVTTFEPEQQDALLADMQQEALRAFQNAASIADRADATTAFAQAAQARNDLVRIIGERRHSRTLGALNKRNRTLAEPAR